MSNGKRSRCHGGYIPHAPVSDFTKRLLGRIQHFGNTASSTHGDRQGSFAPSLAWLLLACAAVGATNSPRRSQPTCLSVSPFRAIASLAGVSDTLGPERWRDLVLQKLRSQPDSAWVFRKAGECPDSMASIDVFQLPGDVVASPSGQVLRIRLEWRHTPGQTEFFLPASGRQPPTAQRIASQLMAVADQMMARVEITSSPNGATVRLGAALGGQEMGRCPLVLLAPPGALSLEFSLQEKIRRMDTLVVLGGFYEVHANFRNSRIDPKVGLEPTRTWPFWSLTLVSTLGGIWAAREQVVAQRAYDRLKAGDDPAQFSRRWEDLRTANLLRNGLLSAGLAFGIGATWLEWSNAQKN